jgi:DNA-binding HxlR family transcriptional regulator
VTSDPDPLHHALSIVGDRWSPAVVAALLDGPRRYGELQQQLAGIAPNVLSARLRRLEREGLLVARPYSERPLRYAYEATEAARELEGALRQLAQWGERHARGFSPADDAEPDLPVEDDELLFA